MKAHVTVLDPQKAYKEVIENFQYSLLRFL